MYERMNLLSFGVKSNIIIIIILLPSKIVINLLDWD